MDERPPRSSRWAKCIERNAGGWLDAIARQIDNDSVRGHFLTRFSRSLGRQPQAFVFLTTCDKLSVLLTSSAWVLSFLCRGRWFNSTCVLCCKPRRHILGQRKLPASFLNTEDRNGYRLACDCLPKRFLGRIAQRGSQILSCHHRAMLAQQILLKQHR